MKTRDLIVALAAGAGPAPRAVVARRLGPAFAGGLACSVLLTLAILGPVRDPAVLAGPLWLKLGYTAALAAATAWLAGRLSRPAAPARPAASAVGAVAALMIIGAALVLPQLEPAARARYALGHSWWFCPWAVFALSLPALAATLWAVRGLAPTHPRAAGLAAGLLAGSAGAAGYALACVEQSALFIALWYTLGIALSGALGWLLGPRVLRW